MWTPTRFREYWPSWPPHAPVPRVLRPAPLSPFRNIGGPFQQLWHTFAVATVAYRECERIILSRDIGHVVFGYVFDIFDNESRIFTEHMAKDYAWNMLLRFTSRCEAGFHAGVYRRLWITFEEQQFKIYGNDADILIEIYPVEIRVNGMFRGVEESGLIRGLFRHQKRRKELKRMFNRAHRAQVEAIVLALRYLRPDNDNSVRYERLMRGSTGACSLYTGPIASIYHDIPDLAQY